MGWLSAGLSDSRKACLLAVAGEKALSLPPKVAPKILGGCSLLRQVTGRLPTLSQVGCVELCPSIFTEGWAEVGRWACG